MSTKFSAEELHDAIKGSEVVSVVNNPADEGQFTLRLKSPDGKKFEVRVFGTDLGWWATLCGNKPK